MATVKPFDWTDVFKFNNINLESTTDTYQFNLYLKYCIDRKSHSFTAVSPSGELEGYVLCQEMGEYEEFHSNIKEISVAYDYRNLGTAASLYDTVDEICDGEGCYFMNLYLHPDNNRAMRFFGKRGFKVFQHSLSFRKLGVIYAIAYEMRKPLAIDLIFSSLKATDPDKLAEEAMEFDINQDQVSSSPHSLPFQT